MNASEELANFINSTSYPDLPGLVVEKAKLSILDALGAAIAGRASQAGGIVASFVKEVWGGDEATVLTGGSSSAIGAALANGYLANALDIDDGGKYTRGHPGAQIIPVTLALGEKYGKTGSEVILATVVGYETAHRVAGCWHEKYEEYRACGSWGSVASAAAAASLINLGKEAKKNALRIADYNSPYLPMKRAIDQPSMVKHGTGWGAMTGIISAEWAKRGFTGPSVPFDGASCNRWFADLGQRFIMAEKDGVEFKEIPSCSWGHPPIKAAMELVDRHEVEVDRIEKVVVEGFSEMAALCQEVPSTEEEAQFSVKWPMAVALVDGKVRPAAMSKERFSDRELKNLFDKIEVKESEELTRMNEVLSERGGETSAWPSRVKIISENGRTVRSGTVKSKPAKIASFTALVEKFERLTKEVLGKKRMKEVIAGVKSFENLKQVETLTALL